MNLPAPPSTDAQSPQKAGLHYGWIVVAVTFLTMMIGASAVGAPGVLIGPLQREFGWSVADISAAFAIRFLLFGAVGPFAAAILSKFGVRRVTAMALLLIAVGVAGSFFMTSLTGLFMLWGVIVGLGTGFIAMILGATIATRWFVARRGLVVGLLSASVATGQVLFMPAFAALEQAHGWRSALILLLVALGVATIMVLILMRDKPADVGLLPYGAAEAPIEPAQSQSLASTLALPLRVFAVAAKTPTFWVLFGTFFICGATTTGLVQTHLVSICGDFGIAPLMAAWMLAAIGAFNLVGTIGSGWLSDRFDSRRLLFWYYGLRALSLFYLPVTDFGFYELSVFTIFYGLDWLATVPPTVKLASEKFGANANIVFGWVFLGHQIGSALAAWGAGLTRSIYDTYLPAFYVSGVLCVIAAAAVFAIRRSPPGSIPQTA